MELEFPIKKALIQHFSQFVTPRKIELFNQVLSKRTRYITVVLENIYHSQNASAVLRTCDCFGIQDVHVIENNYNYTVNPDVALGSYQWLSMHRYSKQESNTTEAIAALKKSGYRIVATTPHTNDTEIEDFDLNTGKVALFFGSEKVGLSQEVFDAADEFVKIPMHGFTESFNISVSNAIISHHLTWLLHKSNIDWQLTESEKTDLLVKWFRKQIKESESIEERFLNEWFF